MPRLSVLVPSFRRPEALQRCLAALAAQSRAPDEVVVGVRRGDVATAAVVAAACAAGWPVRAATTAAPGVVAAMQAALDVATGDVIALTDDDSRPRAGWTEGLLACLAAAPDIGGAGGRDWQPFERGDAQRVGVVQWFGRVIGNHHLGAGAARSVDVLKGVNCAYRAPLLRAVGFDTRLRGAGAQQHWELGVCLPLRRAGWRLMYDPMIAVDHDVAPRHDADLLHRGIFAEAPLVDAVHNETVALTEGRGGVARTAFVLWAFLVGTGEAPGAAQLVRLLLQGDALAVRRWRATLAGRIAGLATARQTPRTLVIPHPGPR
jgi:glycosyltransferase involved in cell wall biosynthesis